MDMKGLDLMLLTKLTSQLVDHVTCLECCKYFIAPETATCGHTLCRTCWRQRRTCPSCAAPLDKGSLKVNIPMQANTQNIQCLGKEFEKLFNIKLDEFVLDIPSIATESSNDPIKNVKDWLASSQNQFSAPPPSSEISTQDVINPIKLSSSKVQIHTNSKKSTSPEKVIYVQLPQVDWDKIEELPDTGDAITNKANSLPTDKTIMELYEGNSEYTMDKPRRSSRKREINNSESVIKDPIILEQQCSKNSTLETDKKSNKAKQNWNNVKRMRKEFSKLNKINRNKLNVSIEMCKKIQNTTNIPNNDTLEHKINEKENDIPNIDETSNKDIEKITEHTVANTKIHKEQSKSDLNKSKEILQSKNDSLDNPLCMQSIVNKENSENDVPNQLQKMSFIKKSTLCPKQPDQSNIQTINIDNTDVGSFNNDDIEISIKIGNTLTNIVIKKKTNDIQLKVNTDREVQTSLGTNTIVTKEKDVSDFQNDNEQNVIPNVEQKQIETSLDAANSAKDNSHLSNKLKTSTKKNTASAETATAQFEITESVEKELSNIMECEEIENTNITNNNTNQITKTQKIIDAERYNNNDRDCCEDLDMFDNGSIHEQNVHLLKNTKHIQSEILVPSSKTTKAANIPLKRDREINDEEEIPSSKKLKSHNIDVLSSDIHRNKNNIIADNDSINYDAIMNQVFSNIDTDIEKSQKAKSVNNNINDACEMQHIDVVESQRLQIKSMNPSLLNMDPYAKNEIKTNEKYSENIFSIIEKDTEAMDSNKKEYTDEPSTQQNIDHLLTPGMCRDLIATETGLQTNAEVIDKEICTPHQEHYDSDRSVVEETPQKDLSNSKQKNKSDFSLARRDSDAAKNINSSQLVKSVINVSDSMVKSVKMSKDVTIGESERKLTSETPLTINKFVDHITHKSTPVARKSLNFDNQNIDDEDPEQTLCPSSVVAKTTQEKEFMSKAFEQTQVSPVKKPLMTKNIQLNSLKFCIAGSCLSPAELANVKLLCRKHNWKYVDKYTKELTHLVVSVDEENKSQRSVKYMCALAASKWIVSNQWVEACLKTNLVLGENHYEVLDGTGEPGPKRSRLAKKKLFQGITFFCMPPFSVLDANTLKEMLEASGGRVVNEAKAVKATTEAPALLLAEPENTQEDKFMYLALELGIVPVNYEWVLNCLGSYTLSSIHDLLLCPSALLPAATAKWPAILIARDSE